MTERSHVDRSTAWVAAASVVAGVLDAVSTILCLQIGVTTAELGAATLAIALFPIVDRLGGMGLIAATVREHEPDRDTLSTIWWLGLGIAVVLTGALVAARPLVANAFPEPIVATMLIAYSARLAVRHVSVVPEALLKRELRYRELSIVQVAGAFAEIAVKLGFAYLGVRGHRELTIWSFVLGPIANGLVTTIGTLLYHPWRPRLVFRRDVAGRVLRFVIPVSGGELLYFAYTNADYLVIGAYFGENAVGVYRVAYELVLDVVRLLSMVTTEVAFPIFARFANDRIAVAAHLLRFTRQNLIVLAVFLGFIGIEADDLLALLFRVRSPEAATIARVMCIVGAVRTLGFILPALLAGVGAASRVLVYNAIAAVVMPVSFVIAAELAPEYSCVAIAWAWAIGYPIAFAALLAMALPHAHLGFGRYLRGLSGIVVCAAGTIASGLLARAVLPDHEVIRVVGAAAVMVASYGVLLARIERVTIASVVRSLRS